MHAERKYHDGMKNAKKNSVTTRFKDSVFAGILIVSALQIASGEGSLSGAPKHRRHIYLFPPHLDKFFKREIYQGE
jgi:hypothetical protein